MVFRWSRSAEPASVRWWSSLFSSFAWPGLSHGPNSRRPVGAWGNRGPPTWGSSACGASTPGYMPAALRALIDTSEMEFSLRSKPVEVLGLDIRDLGEGRVEFLAASTPGSLGEILGGHQGRHLLSDGRADELVDGDPLPLREPAELPVQRVGKPQAQRAHVAPPIPGELLQGVRGLSHGPSGRRPLWGVQRQFCLCTASRRRSHHSLW